MCMHKCTFVCVLEGDMIDIGWLSQFFTLSHSNKNKALPCLTSQIRGNLTSQIDELRWHGCKQARVFCWTQRSQIGWVNLQRAGRICPPVPVPPTPPANNPDTQSKTWLTEPRSSPPVPLVSQGSGCWVTSGCEDGLRYHGAHLCRGRVLCILSPRRTSPASDSVNNELWELILCACVLCNFFFCFPLNDLQF